jgi:hypothetical protein
MRPNYDDAVLRRADMASLQVWTQTALRIVLAIALLWALTTTAMVWYWTGYYGGPPAHEYFGCWVLAWFFTEIIPRVIVKCCGSAGHDQAASLGWSSLE